MRLSLWRHSNVHTEFNVFAFLKVHIRQRICKCKYSSFKLITSMFKGNWSFFWADLKTHFQRIVCHVCLKLANCFSRGRSIYCYIVYVLVSPYYTFRIPLLTGCLVQYCEFVLYCLITLLKLPHCRPDRQWPRFLHGRSKQLRSE